MIVIFLLTLCHYLCIIPPSCRVPPNLPLCHGRLINYCDNLSALSPHYLRLPLSCFTSILLFPRLHRPAMSPGLDVSCTMDSKQQNRSATNGRLLECTRRRQILSIYIDFYPFAINIIIPNTHQPNSHSLSDYPLHFLSASHDNARPHRCLVVRFSPPPVATASSVYAQVSEPLNSASRLVEHSQRHSMPLISITYPSLPPTFVTSSRDSC